MGRPILTRGSVAERVLLFEKRPDVRNSFLDIKRPADAPPKSLLKVRAHPPQRKIHSKKNYINWPCMYACVCVCVCGCVWRWLSNSCTLRMKKNHHSRNNCNKSLAHPPLPLRSHLPPQLEYIVWLLSARFSIID